MSRAISMRISEILKGVFHENKSEFARVIGVSEGSIRSYLNGTLPKADVLERIATNIAISCEWLLTGRGEMTTAAVADTTQTIPTVYSRGRTVPEQAIPVYQTPNIVDLEAFLSTPPETNDYVSLPKLPRCDGAVAMWSDVMAPELKSGDLLVYRRVRDLRKGVLLGQIYMLSVEMGGEEFVLVRYVLKSDKEDCVCLTSKNERADPQDVPVSTIKAMAMVRASIRYKNA